MQQRKYADWLSPVVQALVSLGAVACFFWTSEMVNQRIAAGEALAAIYLTRPWLFLGQLALFMLVLGPAITERYRRRRHPPAPSIGDGIRFASPLEARQFRLFVNLMTFAALAYWVWRACSAYLRLVAEGRPLNLLHPGPDVAVELCFLGALLLVIVICVTAAWLVYADACRQR